jgi:hypothetical protein
MVADFFTKPLQGSLFRKLRAAILNSPDRPQIAGVTSSQECVGKVLSYADVVRNTRKQNFSVVDDARPIVVGNKQRGRE